MTLDWPTVPIIVKLRLLGGAGQMVEIDPADLRRDVERWVKLQRAMVPGMDERMLLREGIVVKINAKVERAVSALAAELARRIAP